MERAKGHEPIRMPIPEYLDSLVAAQKKEDESLDLTSRNLTNAHNLLKFYRGTVRFDKTYRDFKKYFSEPLSDTQYAYGRSQLTGKLFEEIVYFFLSAEEQKNGRVLLSPERAGDFWKRLYPNGEIIDFPNGDTFMRYNIPDGLIVGNIAGKNKILYVCEYSARNNLDHVFTRKAEQLQNDITNFTILKFAKPLIILKNGQEFPPNAGYTNAQVRNIPIGSVDLSKFVDDTVFVYRQSLSALTIAQVQNSVRRRKENDDSKPNGALREQLEKIKERLTLREDVSPAD